MNAVTTRHQAFRALLAALAMPGSRHPIPGPEPLALILDSLYADVEIALQCGAIIIAASQLTPETIERAPRGTELEPETAATLFLQADEQTRWEPVVLQGPGIQSPMRTKVPLSRASLEARARACNSFPLGIDIVAVDHDANVLALPRTTRVELV